MTTLTPQKLAVVGLGYVRRPLATPFRREPPAVRLDVDTTRVPEPRTNANSNREVPAAEIP